MEINEIFSGQLLIIELNGRLDALMAEKADKYFNETVSKNNRDILLDLKNLSYINSTGLRIFIIAFKKQKEKSRRLMVCNMQKKIKEVFQHSGFDNFFEIELTKEQSLADYDSGLE
jgi:anti-sigma B factor antagonist